MGEACPAFAHHPAAQANAGRQAEGNQSWLHRRHVLAHLVAAAGAKDVNGPAGWVLRENRYQGVLFLIRAGKRQQNVAHLNLEEGGRSGIWHRKGGGLLQKQGRRPEAKRAQKTPLYPQIPQMTLRKRLGPGSPPCPFDLEDRGTFSFRAPKVGTVQLVFTATQLNREALP